MYANKLQKNRIARRGISTNIQLAAGHPATTEENSSWPRREIWENLAITGDPSCHPQKNQRCLLLHTASYPVALLRPAILWILLLCPAAVLCCPYPATLLCSALPPHSSALLSCFAALPCCLALLLFSACCPCSFCPAPCLSRSENASFALAETCVVRLLPDPICRLPPHRPWFFAVLSVVRVHRTIHRA